MFALTVPNVLTVFRILLVPVLVAALLSGFASDALAAAVFVLASFTDALDGWLARRHKSESNFWRLMDPLADKLLVTAALISLVQMDLAPAWMVAIILGREFAVTVLRSLAHSRGIAIPASPLGKFKMVSQVVAILLLILGWERMPLLLLAGQAALWLVLATALVSAFDYYRRFTRAMARVSKVADFSVAKARVEERKRA